jgi:hypothetical protein
MSLLAWEGWVGVNGGIKVSSNDVLDQSGGLDVGGGGVWELNPVLEEGLVNPVDELVNTFTSTFMRPVASLLLSLIKNSFNDPVVLLDAVDLSPESKSGCSTKKSESLHSLGQLVSLLLSKGNTSPFKDTSLLHHIGDNEGLVLAQECALFLWHSIDDLSEKVLAFLNPCLLLGVRLFMLDSVNFVVELGVLNLKVGLLNEVRDFLKLVVSIIWVVQHDAVEHLCQVGVEVEFDCTALVAGLL